jgi:hypothetical protein
MEAFEISQSQGRATQYMGVLLKKKMQRCEEREAGNVHDA